MKKLSCTTRYASDPTTVQAYNTTELRDTFLIDTVMQKDSIEWTYSHYDRYMVAGTVPIQTTVQLDTVDQLKSDYFLERRELGIINTGGSGTVTVDGESFELGYKEALYVGRGSKKVIFTSNDSKKPSRFYLNSTPAHTSYPTRKITQQSAETADLGASETSNARTVYKMIVHGNVETCQLQMGMTELKPGNVWNTMPAHTHDRRMEVYFYFEVPEDQSVCHFMGQPQETRHLWLQNEQAIISPPWSIHSGVGTNNYTFIWGMAGENLDYDDMDKVAIRDLR